MAGGKFVKSLVDMVEKSGLDMSEAARMARAKEAGYDVDFPITHGSPNESLSEINKSRFKGDPGNLFDGVFGLRGTEGAGNNPKFHHTFYPRVRKVAGDSDVNFDYNKTINYLKKEYPNASDEEIEGIYDISAGDKNIFDMNENPLGNHGYDDLSEASWEGQRLRGQIAAMHDFDAVAMNDEYGTSYLIPAGSKARKIYAAFDPEKKDSSNLLAGAATVGGVGGAAALASAPQKSFADSLNDMVMQAPPTTREIMDAQTRREKYLAQIDDLNRQDKSIQSPVSNLASKAADFAGQYNAARKQYVNPVLDKILPVGELPEDALRKLSYGDDLTWGDRLKAAAGLL